MSALTLTLKNKPPERLDLAPLNPAALAGKSIAEISAITLANGTYPVRVGDVFNVTGTPDDTLVIDGGSNRFDFTGARSNGGTIIVEGDVGAFAAHKMASGRLEIRGNTGQHLASSLLDGIVVVSGTAGDNLGKPRPGERDGISGGNIVVNGAIGDFAGSRMRRGTIIGHGTIGANAGARMMGGTIWGTRGFGEDAGIQMRRGMLIAPSMANMLPTFVDCGMHDLGIVRIIDRHLQKTLGDLAPRITATQVRRFAGDMSSIGRGEILLTG